MDAPAAEPIDLGEDAAGLLADGRGAEAGALPGTDAVGLGAVAPHAQIGGEAL